MSVWNDITVSCVHALGQDLNTPMASSVILEKYKGILGVTADIYVNVLKTLPEDQIRSVLHYGLLVLKKKVKIQ